MRNTVNRRVNCDAANVDKAVAASREQVEALTRLTDAGIVATLPVKLQEVAVARLFAAGAVAQRAGGTFDPPLTKSCLNHRMRKLMELAGKEKHKERKASCRLHICTFIRNTAFLTARAASRGWPASASWGRRRSP